MSFSSSAVKGLLFDLDGVLYVGGRAIPGAAAALAVIRRAGYPCRFATNTTTSSPSGLQRRLQAMGLPVERNEIVTAASAGVAFLRRLGRPRCLFVLAEETRPMFAEFPAVESDPQYIVIGDIGRNWDFDLINRLFRSLMNGAEILALHKGRYFQVEDGLEIDTGAFVTGLEYAANKTATVIGKPQKAFFEIAISEMGLSADHVVMVGDDLINDVGGAQAAGMAGVLVRTGKYRAGLLDGASVIPDAVVDSIADIPRLLNLSAE